MNKFKGFEHKILYIHTKKNIICFINLIIYKLNKNILRYYFIVIFLKIFKF